jgi:hypothetical protein
VTPGVGDTCREIPTVRMMPTEGQRYAARMDMLARIGWAVFGAVVLGFVALVLG